MLDCSSAIENYSKTCKRGRTRDYRRFSSMNACVSSTSRTSVMVKRRRSSTVLSWTTPTMPRSVKSARKSSSVLSVSVPAGRRCADKKCTWNAGSRVATDVPFFQIARVPNGRIVLHGPAGRVRPCYPASVDGEGRRARHCRHVGRSAMRAATRVAIARWSLARGVTDHLSTVASVRLRGREAGARRSFGSQRVRACLRTETAWGRFPRAATPRAPRMPPSRRS